MLPKTRIAIFGGSFDPPHLGHLTAMIWLREALGYSNIHMVPTHCHNFGKKLEHFDHRVKMCKLLAGKVKGVKVNTIEKELDHPNTTYNLITWYDQKYNRHNIWHNLNEPYSFDLVIGSDLLPELENWDNWKALKAELNKIVVLERPGYDTSNLIPKLDNWDRSIVFKYLFDYYAVGITSISSTQVRENKTWDRRGTYGNKGINHLVGKDIEKYIIKNGLYQ